MSDAVSQLFRVTVAISSGQTWCVLVRAVDEESALGSVRARGHNVVGVAAAEMPRPAAAPPRISCLNCGYLLKNLPVGGAGEILCPECGVINTPLAEHDSVWSEIKATRAEMEAQRKRRAIVFRPRAIVGVMLMVLAVTAISALVIRPLLEWLGWAP